MHKRYTDQRGIAHILLVLLIVIVLAGIGFAGYKVMQANKPAADPKSSTSAKTTEAEKPVWSSSTEITWVADGKGGWISTPYDTTPPPCPDPIRFSSPTPQLSKATSLLYPGQTRVGTFEGIGGNYKPHGGLRFDKSTNSDISVVMPFDGYVMRGSSYLIGGEIQYTFDIVNACGIMVRVGHLRDLSPKFAAIAETFPAASEGDSRTTKVSPAAAFKTGDVIATAVGFKSTTPANVFFDFGVYDLRKNNEAAASTAYQQAHTADAELAYHGLCWLNNLSSKDADALKALPAGDSASGKQSDYC